MTSQFGIYLEIGFDHILDLGAYDHMVFLIALCAIYRFKEWKKVAILATAFTIGHSITLALAALDIITFPKDFIEKLIPITIILTCFYNVFFTKENEDKSIFNQKMKINYLIALFFGLIHGMGFSNELRSLYGNESNIVELLLAFNIGIELGQLLIVAVILAIAFLMMDVLEVKQREWNLFISGAAAGIAVILLL